MIVDLVGVVVDVMKAGIPWSTYAGRIIPLDAPTRIIETRIGPQAGKIPANQVDSWDLSDLDGLMGVPVAGVIANVTGTGATQPTFLTIYPDDAGVPNASNLNLVPGEDVPNLTLTALSDDGSLAVYNAAGETYYLADLAAVVLADPVSSSPMALPQSVSGALVDRVEPRS